MGLCLSSGRYRSHVMVLSRTRKNTMVRNVSGAGYTAIPAPDLQNRLLHSETLTFQAPELSQRAIPADQVGGPRQPDAALFLTNDSSVVRH